MADGVWREKMMAQLPFFFYSRVSKEEDEEGCN
jgi:hypothetical protein